VIISLEAYKKNKEERVLIEAGILDDSLVARVKALNENINRIDRLTKELKEMCKINKGENNDN
jgi:hypothetical protein